MSTVVNKTIVNKFTIVNFTLLTFLFAFSIVLHMVATAISPMHPLLGGLLTLLEMAGWLWILLIWNIAFIKGMWKWVPIIWTRMWAYARTLKKAKEEVTVAQLNSLLSNIDHLGLALHGLTPTLEKGRRTHFQMLGEAVPALVVPAANTALYAEFTRLTQFLNGFGFPAVERVHLHPMDFEFAQNWDTIWRTVSCTRKNASNNSISLQPIRCLSPSRSFASSGIPILRQFRMRATSGFMEH